MANWKVDFTQELSKLCTNLKMRDHRAFIFWYIKATEDMPDDDINERITDRSKDAGSDAVIHDYATKTIKIIQSKYTPNIGNSAFQKDELIKLNKICDYLIGKADYEELREYVHKGLKEKLDSAFHFIKEQQYGIKPIFITTHKANPNSSLYDNEDFPIQINAAREIEIKYNEWLHGHTPELGELDFNFLGLMEGPKDPAAYIVNMESEELRNKYRIYKENLFSRNVRIYNKKYKPNKAIKETLSNSPKNFWYFNNGITILSEKVKINDKEKRITLKNPQIINGCQTVTTIGENKESTANLFVKIVEIEDNIENQFLIDGIIEANNRQSPVDERMLKSNHPLQVKLQRELETLGYYFERKEGQYNEEKIKSKTIGKLKCIKNIDVVKTTLAVEKQPQISFSKEDELFSQYFSEVFKLNKTCLDYLIPYLVWGWVSYIGKTWKRSKVKMSFNRASTLHVLRLIYDSNKDLTNPTKSSELLKFLEHKNRMLECESTIRQLFEVAYNIFEKSGYEGGFAERDFLKSKDSYSDISKSVKVSLKKEIHSMFN